ncbi:hypothetical protein EVAR_27842_1 [Eumeta japonica]|uniref:Uncharacterized protein n=1 Tax=Eumeta variegata TaxID=151549 RepID=A0A4C1VLL8_EUMVA|nr:hypothetical protein EVAR_27842_1 [Eumeta japonica]
MSFNGEAVAASRHPARPRNEPHPSRITIGRIGARRSSAHPKPACKRYTYDTCEYDISTHRTRTPIDRNFKLEVNLELKRNAHQEHECNSKGNVPASGNLRNDRKWEGRSAHIGSINNNYARPLPEEARRGRVSLPPGTLAACSFSFPGQVIFRYRTLREAHKSARGAAHCRPSEAWGLLTNVVTDRVTKLNVFSEVSQFPHCQSSASARAAPPAPAHVPRRNLIANDIDPLKSSVDSIEIRGFQLYVEHGSARVPRSLGGASARELPLI